MNFPPPSIQFPPHFRPTFETIDTHCALTSAPTSGQKINQLCKNLKKFACFGFPNPLNRSYWLHVRLGDDKWLGAANQKYLEHLRDVSGRHARAVSRHFLAPQLRVVCQREHVRLEMRLLWLILLARVS